MRFQIEPFSKNNVIVGRFRLNNSDEPISTTVISFNLKDIDTIDRTSLLSQIEIGDKLVIQSVINEKKTLTFEVTKKNINNFSAIFNVSYISGNLQVLFRELYDVNIIKSSGGGGGSTTLEALTDTDLTGITDGQAITYEQSSGLWKPSDVTASTSQNSRTFELEFTAGTPAIGQFTITNDGVPATIFGNAGQFIIDNLQKPLQLNSVLQIVEKDTVDPFDTVLIGGFDAVTSTLVYQTLPQKSVITYQASTKYVITVVDKTLISRPPDSFMYNHSPTASFQPYHFHLADASTPVTTISSATRLIISTKSIEALNSTVDSIVSTLTQGDLVIVSNAGNYGEVKFSFRVGNSSSISFGYYDVLFHNAGVFDQVGTVLSGGTYQIQFIRQKTYGSYSLGATAIGTSLLGTFVYSEESTTQIIKPVKSNSGSIAVTDDAGGVNFEMTTLDNLTNTTVTAPTNNQVLTYSGGQWINSTPVSIALSDDVPTTTTNSAFQGTSGEASRSDHRHKASNIGELADVTATDVGSSAYEPIIRGVLGDPTNFRTMDLQHLWNWQSGIILPPNSGSFIVTDDAVTSALTTSIPQLFRMFISKQNYKLQAKGEIGLWTPDTNIEIMRYGIFQSIVATVRDVSDSGTYFTVLLSLQSSIESTAFVFDGTYPFEIRKSTGFSVRGPFTIGGNAEKGLVYMNSDRYVTDDSFYITDTPSTRLVITQDLQVNGTIY